MASKRMTKANIVDFLDALEEFTGYKASEHAVDLAFRKFNEAEGAEGKEVD